MSILGFYPGSSITIRSPLPATIPLAFVFVFMDGSGTFLGEIEFNCPSGTRMPRLSLGPINKFSNQPAVAVCGIHQFSVQSSGRHEVTIFLDGNPYVRSFIIES